ncbi:ATP-binding protein [Pseudobacteriovorax antillogorgiicola]|nr:ATP-binding protein [Pseudobacteriovorax antillogorgiicola]
MLEREKVFTALAVNDLNLASKLCEAMTPSVSDYDLKLKCIEANEGQWPQQRMIQELNVVIRDAKKNGRVNSVSLGLALLGWFQSQSGEIAAALESYKQALALGPFHNERTAVRLDFNLAALYIMTGNPEYVNRGFEVLHRLKDQSANKLQSPDNDPELWERRFALASYNLGFAYAIHRRNYEAALPLLDDASHYPEFERSSHVFAALANAFLKRFKAAKQHLAKVDLEGEQSPILKSYYRCYMDLTIKVWQANHSLASCLVLHPETTIDVKLDIFRRLVEHSGTVYEKEALRQFFDLYTKSIEPELRMKSSQAASQLELQRLEMEAQFKDQTIALGEQIKKLLFGVGTTLIFLILVLAYLGRSRVLISRQARDLETERRNLAEVLTYIDEGIIKIDQNMRILPHYSQKAVKILGRKPDSLGVRDIFSALGLSHDELERAHHALKASLGEPHFNWAVNSHHLPQEASIGGLQYLVYWDPITIASRTREVLVSIRDAATQVSFERDDLHKSRLVAIILAGKGVRSFLERLPELLLRFEQDRVLNRKLDLMRQVHTLKGEARSFRLRSLQDTIHSWEERVSKGDDWQRVDLDDIRRESEMLLEIYRNLQDYMQGGRSDLHNTLQNLFLEGQERLAANGFALRYSISITNRSLQEHEETALKTIAIHGITNAIDHGYIYSPRQQGDEAHIEVSLEIQDDLKVFEIRDHGGGIPMGKGPTASSFDWQSQEHLSQEGVTSMTSVQSSSGRGIGLSAIAAAVAGLGGQWVFCKATPQGTSLRVSWRDESFH